MEQEHRKISVVIPVYNSQETLAELVRRLELVLLSFTQSYEIILINDGSSDDSWELIGLLIERHRNLRGINLMRNYGQHNALLCGIRAATYEYVITLDDDLQNPPEEIPTLIDALEEGYDVVYGVPHHEQHGILRDLASQITKLVLQNAMGADIARNISAFRAFRTSLRTAFQNFQGMFVSIDVLLTWGTTHFKAVTVRHDPRTIGVSNYTLRKLIVHAVNLITGFSALPLQLASIMGFGLAVFGLGLLVFVVGQYFVLGYSVPGFPFLASTIAIFSGTQLFALGIIGEYLARMYFRTMERPSYTIRSILSEEEVPHAS